MRKSFTANLRAPASARSFVTSELRSNLGADEHPAREDVVLIVSELVTNSVRAGAAQIQVSVNVRARQVELEVSDDAGGWPAPRNAGRDDPGGRGLAIVEELADSWEATASGRGKRITVTWFR